MTGSTLKKILLFVMVAFLLLFLIIATNETISLYQRLSTTHQVLGILFLILAGSILLALSILPLFALYRYKKLPEPPEEVEGEEYDRYLGLLHGDLKQNRYLLERGITLPGENLKEEIELAYNELNVEAEKLIKKDATSVFLTTSISQNGSLDSLFVLVSLTRLLWRLTTLYERRPSPAKFIRLYTNVAATAMIARGVEDLDLISQQLEPLLASLVGGSVLSLIPGTQVLTGVVVSSIMEGSLNALLTLRVGCIAQGYLTALTKPGTTILRRSAALRAAGLLGGILKENAILVVKSFTAATKKAAKTSLGL